MASLNDREIDVRGLRVCAPERRGLDAPPGLAQRLTPTEPSSRRTIYRAAFPVVGVLHELFRRPDIHTNDVDRPTPRESDAKAVGRPGWWVDGAVEGRVRARGPRRASAEEGQRTQVGRHRPRHQRDRCQPLSTSRRNLQAAEDRCGRARRPPVSRPASTAPDVEAQEPVHRSRGLRGRDRLPSSCAAADAREGEAGRGARHARWPPLLAQPPTLGRVGLAHEYGLPVTTVSAMMGHANPSSRSPATAATPAIRRRWSRTC